jgi:hypothetical protein
MNHTRDREESRFWKNRYNLWTQNNSKRYIQISFSMNLDLFEI